MIPKTLQQVLIGEQCLDVGMNGQILQADGVTMAFEVIHSVEELGGPMPTYSRVCRLRVRGGGAGGGTRRFGRGLGRGVGGGHDVVQRGSGAEGQSRAVDLMCYRMLPVSRDERGETRAEGEGERERERGERVSV